jgi:hypothetical protein
MKGLAERSFGSQGSRRTNILIGYSINSPRMSNLEGARANAGWSATKGLDDNGNPQRMSANEMVSEMKGKAEDAESAENKARHKRSSGQAP